MERHRFVCESSATRPGVAASSSNASVYIRRRVYILKRNRCRTEHLTRGQFFADVLIQLSLASNTSVLDAKDVKEYMKLISQNGGATPK